MERFEKIRVEKLSFLKRLEHIRSIPKRTNFGIRYVKAHELEWL